MLATSHPRAKPAFDPARCLACLASDRPEKRACAAARLIAEGFDPTDIAATPKPVRQ